MIKELAEVAYTVTCFIFYAGVAAALFVIAGFIVNDCPEILVFALILFMVFGIVSKVTGYI